jgi:hypothetical protein
MYVIETCTFLVLIRASFDVAFTCLEMSILRCGLTLQIQTMLIEESSLDTKMCSLCVGCCLHVMILQSIISVCFSVEF